MDQDKVQSKVILGSKVLPSLSSCLHLCALLPNARQTYLELLLHRPIDSITSISGLDAVKAVAFCLPKPRLIPEMRNQGTLFA